uniref:uncharacterized protein LOC131104634 isoform X1 n=1 Tax=Doryrhamphus excisus TaxID=161450 RepID=UPI0025AE7F13|nr:uncharacterized protein LOC131104634 isoform X1 [Doryrhamphus excisus]
MYVIVIISPYCLASAEGPSGEDMSGGPTVRRVSQFVPETVLSEDECKEAMSLMKHSADEDTVRKKMKLTFVHRRNMVLVPQQSSNILSDFPRFKDIRGLVEQDFALMFGEDVSGKFLEKWSTTFKKKIIQQCRTIPSTSELKELLLAADPSEDGDEVDIDYGHPLLLVLLMNFLRYTSCLRHHTTPCSTTCTRSSKPLCTTLMLANFMPT